MSIAWLILSHAISERDIAADRATARARGGDWEGWVSVASVALDQERVNDAEYAALQAIEAAPMRPQGPTMLVAVRQRQGRNEEAGRIVSAVGLLGWRHIPAQALLLQSATEQRNFQAAVLRADAILRQTHQPEKLIQLPRRLSAEAGALPYIAERLSNRPLWRGAVLVGLSDLKPNQYAEHFAILRMLKRTASPPSGPEITSFSQKMIDERRYADAARIWATLSDNKQGGLDTGSPFDWKSQPAPGLEVSISGGGSSITISTEGSIAGRAIERIVILPPGSHRLRGVIDSTEDIFPKKLRWTVVCASTRADLRTSLPADQGMGGVDIPFSVPADCPAILVGLSPGQTSGAVARFSLRDFRIE